MNVARTTLPRAERQESPHHRSGNPSSPIPRFDPSKHLHTSNWNLSLHSTTPHTNLTHTQWPQSSDAPLSAQLALSAPQASTRALRTLLLPPAAKPTRTLSSRAPARTPSSTYVDNTSAASCTPRKTLRTTGPTQLLLEASTYAVYASSRTNQ